MSLLLRSGLLLVVLGASSAVATPMDDRWVEQVLPLRKGTFEIGLGAGAWVSTLGHSTQFAFDPNSTLRLGVLDWLEVSPAWLRARVTPKSERGGVLVGAGLAGFGFSSITGLELFPSIAVEGYLKAGSFIAVGRLAGGVTVGVRNGLAFSDLPIGNAATSLLYRVTERWVLLSTFTLAIGVNAQTHAFGAQPGIQLRTRSYFTPAWAIDLWLSAGPAYFAPGLSVVFAPSGLF